MPGKKSGTKTYHKDHAKHVYIRNVAQMVEKVGDFCALEKRADPYWVFVTYSSSNPSDNSRFFLSEETFHHGYVTFATLDARDPDGFEHLGVVICRKHPPTPTVKRLEEDKEGKPFRPITPDLFELVCRAYRAALIYDSQPHVSDILWP